MSEERPDQERPNLERPNFEPAGDRVCWLESVCEQCGALLEVELPASCWRCGALVEAR